MLNEEDVLSGRLFEDTIARGCWPIDVHGTPGSTPSPGLKARHAIKEPYGIPYRCLVPRDIDGLLVAGRCISATRAALGSTRVGGTSMALGEAAGTAAAVAAATKRKPRELDGAGLRQVLRQLGAEVG
jgi:hypothetical protein